MELVERQSQLLPQPLKVLLTKVIPTCRPSLQSLWILLQVECQKFLIYYVNQSSVYAPAVYAPTYYDSLLLLIAMGAMPFLAEHEALLFLAQPQQAWLCKA